MRITVKSNVYFKRLKGKKVPKLIMEQLLKPLGRAALKKVQDLQKSGGNEKEIIVFEKMVMRSLFGNINASRNSA